MSLDFGKVTNLKSEKERNYPKVIDLTGTHTISGYIDKEVTSIDPEVKKAIKSCSLHKVKNKEQYQTYLQINPNKLKGKQKLITSYSEYEEALKRILKGVGAELKDFRLSRADMCFNSTDPNCYEDYKKLHRLLICCIAETYSFKNVYQSYDLWTYKSLSVAIKNDNLEAENYDKECENPDDESKNRLEIRTKKIDAESDLKHEFLELGCHRIEEAIKNFEAVMQHQNMELERLYKEDLAKDKKDRDYLNLTAFLLQYKECIYNSSQMVDLLSRFDEVENPKVKAENFKKAHHIEYFSMTDLRKVVRHLKRKMKGYFNS